MTRLTSEVVRESNTEITAGKAGKRLLTITLSPSEGGDQIIMRPKGCTKDTLAVSLEDVWKLALAPLQLCNDCNKELDRRMGKEAE
jgi:hypothetical protein